jgi:hypothetical protein
MSDLKLIGSVVSFLRKYGNLSNPAVLPLFTAPVRKNPLGQRHPLFEEVQNQEIAGGDAVFMEDYSKISLPLLSDTDFFGRIEKDIPDSDECTVIDVGSSLGYSFMQGFAAKRPNVQFVFVDNFTDDRIRKESMPYPEAGKKTSPLWQMVDRLYSEGMQSRSGIEEYSPQKNQLGIEHAVNRAFSEYGLKNIRYVQKELSLQDYGLNMLSHLPDIQRRKRVFVTGLRNDRGLGSITALLGIKYNAEQIYFNNSSLEEIHPTSEHFGMMRKFLKEKAKMYETEISGLILRLHQPQSRYLFAQSSSGKYNYNVSAQKCFAQALKLPFILAQKDYLEKKGYSADVYFRQPDNGMQHYTLPDHHVIARSRISVFSERIPGNRQDLNNLYAEYTARGLVVAACIAEKKDPAKYTLFLQGLAMMEKKYADAGFKPFSIQEFLRAFKERRQGLLMPQNMQQDGPTVYHAKELMDFYNRTMKSMSGQYNGSISMLTRQR